MRQFIKPVSILLAFGALTGCGKAASLTAPSVLAPAQAQAAAPSVRVTASGIVSNNAGNLIGNNAGNIVSNNAGNIISNNSARVAQPNPTDPSLILDPSADLDLAYADANPPASPAAEAAEDAKLAAEAKAAEDAPPPYNIDDRMPYGVVVAERSAHTLTIAWRTNVPTKGLIEFAKTRDYAGSKLFHITPKGFTDSVRDDVAKTDHKYVITGLSRFTSYTFKVTAVTALGLPFAEKVRTQRTKFWAWR